MIRFWFVIGMHLTSLAAWCINKSIASKGIKETAADVADFIDK